MKNKESISKREKTAAFGLVVCFVAMIGIVGMLTFSQKQQEIKLQEKQMTQLTKEKENIKEEQAKIANTDEIQSQLEMKTEIMEKNITPIESSVEKLNFSGADTLAWPIEGNVLLSYSMDKTIHFSTLDQYKYNPAIIIGGNVGTEVKSSAIGEVISIETSAQTGTTITVNIGSGYEVIYGQLKDICVEKGDRVTKGQVIGYLSEPTKYYNVEGPNLYFQMLKEGDPVNPLEYFEA